MANILFSITPRKVMRYERTGKYYDNDTSELFPNVEPEDLETIDTLSINVGKHNRGYIIYKYEVPPFQLTQRLNIFFRSIIYFNTANQKLPIIQSSSKKTV